MVIETNNDRYQYGCIAIAYMPAQFTDVNVVCDDMYTIIVIEKLKPRKRVAEKRLKYPQPKLVKVIDLKTMAQEDSCVSHLTGTGEWFLLLPSIKSVYLKIGMQ